MSLYNPYTDKGKCVFCEIIKGNIKTPGIFYEDNKFIAFLSKFPNTEGFSVVVTKDHYGSDVLNLPDKVLKEFIIVSKKVSNILLNYFDDVGRVGLIIEGTGIDHAHIKLFPMHGTKDFKKGEWEQHVSKINKYFKKYPGYISSHDSYKEDDKKLKELARNIKKFYKN